MPIDLLGGDAAIRISVASMREFKAKSRSITSELGRLVICWNDLELEIRVLLLTISNDAATVEALTSQLDIAAVFIAMRKLANQYDAHRRRLDTRLTIEADTLKKKIKLYDQAAPRAVGLAAGLMSLTGGGPFTAPAMDPNYTYSQVIILLTDGLNTQDRWYSVQSQIEARQTMTCNNIKAAGITLYTSR